MVMKLTLLLAALLMAFPGTVSAEPDPNFYVFLCFGQSNMEGGAPPEEQDQGEVDERFQMLAAVDMPQVNRQKGQWYTATPPLCRGHTRLGPADFFGRTMVANLPEHVRVGVINVSVAGTRIEGFQTEAHKAYYETAPDWMKNIVKQYDGDPYQRLVEMARIAQKDGVIKGMLLHQGESNPNDAEWCNKVKGIYDNLMTDLNLNPEDVPLLAGELLGEDQNGKCAAFNTVVLKDLPTVIPTAHIIPSKGCEGTGDGLHFSTAGFRELGKRYAEKMLQLLNVEPKASAAATPPAAAAPLATPATP